MPTLAQLITSSSAIVSKNNIATHGAGRALAKEFGTIYYNNKTVLYDEASSILEIRMIMGTKTETQYSGFHACRIALYGCVGKVYDSIEDLYWDKIMPMYDDQTVTTDSESHIKALKKAYNSRKGKQTTKSNVLPDENIEKLDVAFGEDINSRLTGTIIPVTNTSTPSEGKSFGAGGKIFYLEQPIDINQLCRVECSCSDYYYRCAWYNYEAGAHLGAKPNPYPNRTGKTETVQNKFKMTGLCKHLMVMAMLLLNGGIMKGIGEGTFDAYKQVIKDRDSKLNIPRKLADGNELERMYTQLNRNITKARTTRNNHVGYKANHLTGYSSFKKSIISQNTQSKKAGTFKGSPTQGSSKAAYQNSAVQRWAQEIHERKLK